MPLIVELVADKESQQATQVRCIELPRSLAIAGAHLVLGFRESLHNSSKMVADFHLVASPKQPNQ
jgi:hypothetical protein